METFLRKLLNDSGFKRQVSWEKKSFPANTEIVKQGDSSRQLFIIEKGNVRVLGRVVLNDNRSINPGVCDLTDGDVFGELALFDNSPRSATVSAITDCELIVIDGDQLMAYLDAHPEIGYQFLKQQVRSVVARLRNTNEKILSLLAWGLKAHQVDDHL